MAKKKIKTLKLKDGTVFTSEKYFIDDEGDRYAVISKKECAGGILFRKNEVEVDEINK